MCRNDENLEIIEKQCHFIKKLRFQKNMKICKKNCKSRVWENTQ